MLRQSPLAAMTLSCVCGELTMIPLTWPVWVKVCVVRTVHRRSCTLRLSGGLG